MNDINESLRHKLESLRNLAMKGATQGERENAQKLFDKFCEKYDIDSEIFNEDEESVIREFFYHGNEEKVLLVQISYKITDSPDYYAYRGKKSGRLSKTSLGLYCTKAQKVQIEYLFEFYKRVFEKEKDYFMKSFLCKHNLFGNTRSSENETKLSTEEIIKIRKMMSGLDSESPLLAITEG